MRKYWDQREPRERSSHRYRGCIICAAIWLAAGFKAVNGIPQKRKKRAYEQANADLKIIKAGETALQGQTIQAEKKVLSAQNFQSTITGSAGKHGLKISRRQPKGDTELSVWLEDAATTAFYAWADELTSTYNMTATQVHLSRNDDGSVRVNITYKLEL